MTLDLKPFSYHSFFFPENIPPPPPPSFDQSFEDTQNSLDDLAYQLQNLGQD